MKMVKMVVKTKISADAYVKVYSPQRAVIEYNKKVKRLVNQPLLPGYLLIETECDLLPVYMINNTTSFCETFLSGVQSVSQEGYLSFRI